MISYPEANYVQAFSAEMAERTAGLPLYDEGPGVDYEEAKQAYALEAILLYDPDQNPQSILANGPSGAAQILLVERASGHGEIGSVGGVSGYIDTLHDPTQQHTDAFDPIAYTLRKELVAECGFTESSFGLVDFYAAAPVTHDRTVYPGAKITVVSILGVCSELPDIVVDGKELASYKWVDLRRVKEVDNLSRGYLQTTLPSALEAIGLEEAARAELLNP